MKKSLSISFVLPMFNERANIEKTIKKIKHLAGYLTNDYEIVIVDDASTDGCPDIVVKLAKTDNTIKLFRMKNNSKFGGAFAIGFKKASKQVIVYTDSDMPVSDEDIKKSFPLIKEYDIITGYSKIKKGDTFNRKVISQVYNFIIQVFFRLDIKDINSGYKIVRREVVEDLSFVSRSPFVDVEIFIHAAKKGCTIFQYPLVFSLRDGGKSYISGVSFLWATFVDIIRVRVKNGIKTKKRT